jgi:hypothetical protein
VRRFPPEQRRQLALNMVESSTMTADADRAARALARAAYSGEVVRANTLKPSLFANLGPLERLACMSRLCRRQWLASGGQLVERPRSEWPGEIFRICRG